MSFAHFDELEEICWKVAEEEEMVNKAKHKMDQVDLMNALLAESNRWWEEAAKEVLKERELFHV